MSEALSCGVPSWVELAEHEVELLPARTVLSCFGGGSGGDLNFNENTNTNTATATATVIPADAAAAAAAADDGVGLMSTVAGLLG
ncbi:MAG: hypothetical protein LC799_24185 [Actinobacteria bacterium]|nr:hypothetical protein [Actinomycetota bacterium]